MLDDDNFSCMRPTIISKNRRYIKAIVTQIPANESSNFSVVLIFAFQKYYLLRVLILKNVLIYKTPLYMPSDNQASVFCLRNRSKDSVIVQVLFSKC